VHAAREVALAGFSVSVFFVDNPRARRRRRGYAGRQTMLLKTLREEVLEANLEIVRRGLVLYTFGNASGFDAASALVVIKPSGVPFNQLTPADMVVTNLDAHIIEGDLRPSSDLDTHVLLYRTFDGLGGIVHTHSTAATAWSQAGLEIPCFGTTHADYFHGPVPVTGPLSDEEIMSAIPARPSCDASSRSIPSPAPPCWSATTARLPGAARPPGPPSTPSFSRKSPASPPAASPSTPRCCPSAARSTTAISSVNTGPRRPMGSPDTACRKSLEFESIELE
jgi:hypothetical protein